MTAGTTFPSKNHHLKKILGTLLCAIKRPYHIAPRPGSKVLTKALTSLFMHYVDAFLKVFWALLGETDLDVLVIVGEFGKRDLTFGARIGYSFEAIFYGFVINSDEDSVFHIVHIYICYFAISVANVDNLAMVMTDEFENEEREEEEDWFFFHCDSDEDNYWLSHGSVVPLIPKTGSIHIFFSFFLHISK